LWLRRPFSAFDGGWLRLDTRGGSGNGGTACSEQPASAFSPVRHSALARIAASQVDRLGSGGSGRFRSISCAAGEPCCVTEPLRDESSDFRRSMEPARRQGLSRLPAPVLLLLDKPARNVSDDDHDRSDFSTRPLRDGGLSSGGRTAPAFSALHRLSSAEARVACDADNTL
jgi:hypothetical protein